MATKKWDVIGVIELHGDVGKIAIVEYMTAKYNLLDLFDN